MLLVIGEIINADKSLQDRCSEDISLSEVGAVPRALANVILKPVRE